MVVRPESGLAQAGKYFGNLILRILRRFSRRKPLFIAFPYAIGAP
jgi:hypothetical protein